MRQQVYLEQRFGVPQDDGGVLFWLLDPIVTPSRAWQITCNVVHVAIPLTHYVVTLENSLLNLEYGDPASGFMVPSLIPLLPGNYSIDEIVDYINTRLGHGYVLTYSDNTNNLRFEGGVQMLRIGDSTTCGELLGFAKGQTASPTPGAATFELAAEGYVDLSGTSCFYLSSSIRTRNRDPVTRGYSYILAKVPITRAHNGLERYVSPEGTFGVWDRHFSHITVQVLDDRMRPIQFHGGSWSITLEFDVAPRLDYGVDRDYRENLAMLQAALAPPGNGQVRREQDPPADQRADQGDGGQQRGAGADIPGQRQADGAEG